MQKSCVSLVFAIMTALPVSASSIASASAMAGSNNCAQTDSNSANCAVSFPVGSQTATASASAAATWAMNGSGRLEATVLGSGPNTTGSASTQYSASLIVTGVSGTGDLRILFSGFQMNLLSTPGGASVSPVGIALGTYSTSATLPSRAPQPFSVVAPAAFGVPLSFDVGFGATAAGGFFNHGQFASNDSDGLLNFPSFVVTDSNGAVLRDASVQFVPEPASWLLAMLGLSSAMAAKIRKKASAIPEETVRS